jgi:hypothetical protein
VRDLGEVEYNRPARENAVRIPTVSLALSLERAALFWFPTSDPIRSVIFALLSLTSIAGTVIPLRRDVTAGLVLAIPLLVQPIPHYLVHVNVRHKYPTDWIWFIGMAVVMITVYSVVMCRYRTRIEPAARPNFAIKGNRL